MKRLYLWLLEKSKHRHAPWYLAAISFTESFISFIPPDPMMVPMIVVNKTQAWFLALLTTVSSVLGGIIGYAIGFYLFESLGIPLLKTYGLMDKITPFQVFFHQWGFWAIVIKAFTPIPFKLVTITAGALKFSFSSFLLASTLSRGIRFYLEAAVVWKWGAKMNDLIQKEIILISSLFIGLLIGGVLILKCIH